MGSRRGAIVGLLCGLFLGLVVTTSAQADCWYFSYRYRGAGPYHLGPYGSRAQAQQGANQLANGARQAGHSFQLISMSDYCAGGGGGSGGGTGGGGTGGGGTGGTTPSCYGQVDYPYYRIYVMGPRPGGNPQVIERFYWSRNGQTIAYCRSGADNMARTLRNHGYYASVQSWGSYRWFPGQPRCSAQAMSCNSQREAILVTNNGSYPLPR